MFRYHSHITRDLSSGFITFTLPEEDVKTLYYALLANKDRAKVFDELSKFMTGLWK